MNYELIEKLRKGEIMVINNGSIKDLHSVLNCASDELIQTRGLYNYYGFEEGDWYGNNSTYLPKVDISSFFLPTPKMIPVEDLEKLINDNKTYQTMTNGLIDLINKYK